MTEKTINNIVWWIPFRKLRDSVREVLYSIMNINNSTKSSSEMTIMIKDIYKVVTKNIIMKTIYIHVN